MSYEIGEHIDLGHLNGGLPKGGKKSTEASNATVEVGTQFVFQTIGDRFQAARRIQVVSA